MAGAYTAACTSAGCRVLLTVTEAYSSKTKDLICSGNRTVELLDARMVDLDMAPLAVALEETNPFQTIDVSYNTLGAGAAESLRKLVAADSTITSLDLSQNDFNESACRALCEGLKQNRAIGSLNLSGNKLGGPGGMALADLLQTNSTLEALYASNCELDTAALIALATVLRDNTSLRVLDVSRPLAKTVMDEPANHFARMLKVNTTLHELDMSKSGLSDKGLQLLAESVYRAGPNSRLEVLKVKCNRITLVDADCVGALRLLLSSEVSRLQTLLLGANTLRDEGALKLAEVRTRERERLSHTTRLVSLAAHFSLSSPSFCFSCCAQQVVAESKRLQHLDVASCEITSRGLCALARSVVDRVTAVEHQDPRLLHQSMDAMELWGNKFDSAACLAWIPALHYLKLDIAVQEVDGAYACVRC